MSKLAARVHDENALADILSAASVIVIVFGVESEENLQRVGSYWMPLIQSILGPDDQRPVLIVANKSDDASRSDYVSKMVHLMNEYVNFTSSSLF